MLTVPSLQQYDYRHVSQMSERLVEGLTSGLDHVIRNGDEHQSYPGRAGLSVACY